MKAWISFHLKKIPEPLKGLVGGLVFPFLIFLLSDLLFPLKTNINFSTVIVSSDGSILYCFLNNDQKWRIKTELNEITPLLKKTIIEKEDKYFRYHPGINIIAVSRALFKNITGGKVTSGASTITMQVARMLEPKERNYCNKLVEMFRALQLEWHFSKNEILQMYLNLVPYGGNIEGVKTASVFYFQQEPEKLSPGQVVTLAIIPNDPNALRMGQNNSFIMQKRNFWLKYFEKSGIFEPEKVRDALNEPLDAYRHNAPKNAPHISLYLKKNNPGADYIRTWINSEMQLKTEQLISNYIKALKSMNITNAAAIILDNKKKSVVTYVGSADFYDQENQGQVDGIRAIRSPGSTLKPFLYALAADQGLITPKLVIADVPINYNGYMPENYDGTFHGFVTIEKALALSLNVPAVKILDQYGKDRFLDKLGKAGFKTIRKRQKNIGYSVILGGCGVTLHELTSLFSAFANNGVRSPARMTKDENMIKPDTLFSNEASYMITQILCELKRPDLPNKFENTYHLPKIAWKTGTSYGRKDAWAIGYNHNFTVGVWVGNFDGTGVAELSGAEYAVPLLFDIFNNIDYNSNYDWFMPPDNLDFRLVCSETGLIPNDFCTNLVMDSYIPAVSSNQKCQHLKKVFTDPDGKISYCTSCLPESGYKIELFNNFTAEVLTFYDDKEIPYKKIPPHNPDCSRIYTENGPQIISLTDGTEYILFKNEKQQLMLRSSCENGVKKVYWYINNKFYQSCDANDRLFFTPGEGEIKISCTDDKGRNTNIWITVKFI